MAEARARTLQAMRARLEGYAMRGKTRDRGPESERRLVLAVWYNSVVAAVLDWRKCSARVLLLRVPSESGSAVYTLLLHRHCADGRRVLLLSKGKGKGRRGATSRGQCALDASAHASTDDDDLHTSLSVCYCPKPVVCFP